MLWMKQSRSATHKKRSVSYAHSSRPEELRLRNGAPVTVKLWPENEGFNGQLAMHHLAVYRVPPSRDRSGKASFRKIRGRNKGLATTKVAKNGVSGLISRPGGVDWEFSLSGIPRTGRCAFASGRKGSQSDTSRITPQRLIIAISCCEIPFSIVMVSLPHDRFATQMAGSH